MTQQILDMEIKDTKLSVRTKNCLKFSGIEHVSTLQQLEAWELLRIPNMGRKSVEQVIEFLSSHGITLKGQDKFYKRKQQLPWVVKLIDEAVAQERARCSARADVALLGTHVETRDRVLRAIRLQGMS